MVGLTAFRPGHLWDGLPIRPTVFGQDKGLQQAIGAELLAAGHLALGGSVKEAGQLAERRRDGTDPASLVEAVNEAERLRATPPAHPRPHPARPGR